MKTVVFIISEVDKSLHFEWLFKKLKGRVQLRCILIGEKGTELELYLRACQIPVDIIEFRSKKNILAAWVKCVHLLRKQKATTVHTHFWIGSLIGITAAFVLGVRKRVLTRHHANFHHDYFPKGVFLDKILNRLATVIVAPTEIVKDILRTTEKVNEDKIRVINHGIDFELFTSIDPEAVNGLRNKYRLSDENFPVVGVISRYFELKGIQYIIPAFQKIILKYPKAKLILANAQGDYTVKIHEQLKELPSSSFVEIAYEPNVSALYKLFDVFVHAPVAPNSESFGLIYLESLALGVPSVFTLSGIANEIVVNGENALVANYRDSESLHEKISNIVADSTLRNHLQKNALSSVAKFSMDNMAGKLVGLYNS
jgi:glycosyltransferase involved in cell wall biosynthesis